MRRWVAIGLAVLLLVGGVVGGVFWFRSKTATREVRGSSTVEFRPTERPGVQSRPTELLRAVPWPTYGYDAQRSHFAPFRLRPPYRQIWMRRTGWYLEFPPAVGYGKVFASQLRGRFLALDRQTGVPVWQRWFEYCSAASPALAGGLVFAAYVPQPCSSGPRDRPGLVVAMRAADGKVVWRSRLASESSPLVRNGRVYVGAWDHRVYALAARTGKVAWSTETDGEINSSAAYSSGLVYIGTNAGSIYALDARTGAVRWRSRSFSHFRTGREYFYATPAVAYGRVYASNTDGTVYAFGATTGHLLWARHVGTYVYTAPGIWDRKVYVGTYDGKFDALDAATGDLIWQHEAPGSIHGAPTIMGGLVYFATCGTCGQHGSRYAKLGPRGTFALDARTGRRVWSFPDGHYAPIVADERRVYLVGSTRLYGLDPVSR